MKALVATWIAALVVVACAKSEPKASHGGETNWLEVCDGEHACERGECLCGVCTIACASASECAGGFAGACTDGARAGLCDEAIDVCLPECSSDDACGPGFACDDGVCTWVELAEEDWIAVLSEAQVQQDDNCCRQQGSVGVRPDVLDATIRGHEEDRPRASTGVRFDRRAAAACLAEIARSECRPQKDPIDRTRPNVCGRVYERGTLEVGDACVVYSECSEADGVPTDCDSTFMDGEVLHFCEPSVVREEGESCADDYCRHGLWCDPETELCVAPAARGEACLTGPGFGDTCAIGSLCDRDAGICIAPLAVGEPCDFSEEQCENLACFGGLCREPFFLGNSYCIWDEPDASATTE